MSNNDTKQVPLLVRIRNIFTNELIGKNTINASHYVDFEKMINPFSVERTYSDHRGTVGTVIGYGIDCSGEWFLHTTETQHEEIVKQFKDFVEKRKNKTTE